MENLNTNYKQYLHHIILTSVMLLVLILPHYANTINQTDQYHHKSHIHHHHRHHHSHRYITHNDTYAVNNHTTASIISKQTSLNITHIDTTTDTTLNLTNINMRGVANQPKLYSYAALVVNATNGEVLISKHPTTQLPIASISKLMMAMVLLDAHDDPNQYITITSADIDTLRNTSSRLRIGMQLKRRDLLLLALMSSENRAAFALARTAYPGGTKVFLQKMNQKSQTLGMKHTVFYDPTGLNDQNQSTAEDLARMVKAAFNYPEIRQDTTTKSADVHLYQNYVHHYLNSDVLVRNGDQLNIALSKTGFINEAGHCLVLYSIIKDKPIIMIFLNSTGKSGRMIDAITLKRYIERQII